MTVFAADRAAVQDFYDAYYGALDDGDLQAWPDFFTESCLYRVIPRENWERGRTLSTMAAESRGMLKDRVRGLLETQVYAPRYYRRFPSPIRILSAEPDSTSTRHNLLVVQTIQDKQSDIVLSAACHDRLVTQDGRLRFAERIVVFDSEMVPNSLIYPA